MDSLRLRAGNYDQPVNTLSGGNQQKVILARWLLAKPRVIMFDEPTKGIDVGAKGELYEVIKSWPAKDWPSLWSRPTCRSCSDSPTA